MIFTIKMICSAIMFLLGIPWFPIVICILLIMGLGQKLPKWWMLVTALITVIATILLQEDIFYDADFGMLPFIIMGIYALVSFAFSIKTKQHKTDITTNLPETYIAADGREWNWEDFERWEDYPFPREDIEHTYCLVHLGEKKSYYYRTRNPEIKVGDLVYVPVGNEYERVTGEVISIKTYNGQDVPYPLEKTKHIIGKR